MPASSAFKSTFAPVLHHCARAAHAEALKEVEAAEAAAAEGDEDEFAEVRIHKKKTAAERPEADGAAAAKETPCRVRSAGWLPRRRADAAAVDEDARGAAKGGGENVRLRHSGRALFMDEAAPHAVLPRGLVCVCVT